MTQEQEDKRHAFWIWVDNIAGRISRLTVIFGFLALFFSYVLWGHAYLQKLGEIPERIDVLEDNVSTLTNSVVEMKNAHARLAQEVDRATQPREIFEIDEQFTQARGGFCAEFQRCILDVRMRRTAEGEACTFLQGRDRYFFIDSAGQRVEVERIDHAPDPDIGREWFDFHWEFETPARLKAPVAIEFQRAYTKCRDEDDGAVIAQASDPILIEIRPAPERATP